MTQNTKIWLHGLAGAAIGSSASSMATILVAPDRFNLSSLAGTGHVVVVAVVSGIVAAAAYLAKSPLPTLRITETRESVTDGDVKQETTTKSTTIS